MNCVKTKLTTASFSKTIIPAIKTHLINQLIQTQTAKVAAAYRHTKCTQHHSREHGVSFVGSVLSPKIRKKLQSRKWESLWKSFLGETASEQPKYNHNTRNVRLPDLINIKNILKAQPKQVWRAIWPLSKDEKRVEWPIFNRGVQYEGSLRSLQKVRPNSSLPLFNQKELREIQGQLYLPHRVRNLGPDLAAVHFFTDRRAAVKLTNQGNWIVGGAPKFTSIDRLNRCISGSFLDEECYVSGCYVEALDCSNFHYNGVRFEGLEYLAGLRFLKWLSLKNQKYINVWCLDRIAGLNGATLEYLDISKCNLDMSCIVALTRMPKLQTLVIKHPGEKDDVKNALSILEEANPKLNIRSINTDFA